MIQNIGVLFGMFSFLYFAALIAVVVLVIVVLFQIRNGLSKSNQLKEQLLVELQKRNSQQE